MILYRTITGMDFDFPSLRLYLVNLSDRAVSKECEAEDTEGRDDLADDPDDGDLGAVAGDPVDDPDTHSDRHKNDQCEVRSSQRNYIESAETGSDQHGNGKKDSDCFHKNAPLWI